MQCSTVEPRLSGPRLSRFPNKPKLILNNPKMDVITHALYDGGILQVFS